MNMFGVNTITNSWEVIVMLFQPVVEKLRDMRLYGMLSGMEEQAENPEYKKLSFEERLGLLVDLEWSIRQDRKLKTRIKNARFKDKACIEDLDFSSQRGLDRSQVLYLAQGQWITKHLNTIITGATGTGKTYLACALGDAACKHGFTVLYSQMPKLLRELDASHRDGSYDKLLTKLTRTNLLILDDWLIDALSFIQTKDMLEILDDRYNRGSTILATQLPVSNWHSRFEDPTLADAIMDRVVHNAYRIELKGESMRKKEKSLTQSGH
jgi:DNA replication protein DnaC